jgi:hypothetical protein
MRILTSLDSESEPTTIRRAVSSLSDTLKGQCMEIYTFVSLEKGSEKLGLHCRLSCAIKEQMHEFQSLEQKRYYTYLS